MTEMRPCVWAGCDRLGAVHAINAPFCAYHHPAGRAHIEALLDKVADIAGLLEFYVVKGWGTPDERAHFFGVEVPAWVEEAEETLSRAGKSSKEHSTP